MKRPLSETCWMIEDPFVRELALRMEKDVVAQLAFNSVSKRNWNKTKYALQTQGTTMKTVRLMIDALGCKVVIQD